MLFHRDSGTTGESDFQRSTDLFRCKYRSGEGNGRVKEEQEGKPHRIHSTLGWVWVGAGTPSLERQAAA